MLSASSNTVIQRKTHSFNIKLNNQRRLSIISKQFDNEHIDQQIEIIGSELPQSVPDHDGNRNQRRLTQIVSITENLKETTVRPRGRYLLLFLIEPIITGCFLFPLLVLFWDCGWNLTVTMLNALNKFPLKYRLDGQNYTDEEVGDYAPQSLVVPYIIIELMFSILYLTQDLIYDFLKTRHFLIQTIFVKLHALLLASLYIGQWNMIWNILDQYIPEDWEFIMLLSMLALSVLMVVTGTLADMVCSPFVISLDSIEYCIRFECPLETENMSRWKVNLINFVYYEIMISNITIFGWYGFYTILDQYLYPDDTAKSAWICLLVGYPLYFPLMYSQYFFEKINLKCELWKTFSTNFPQFYRNIMHGLAFAGCLFLWRGFWVLYDFYLYIFEEYHKTYLLVALLTFGFLSLIQTFSSMNGPLSTMEDDYRFFPVYPHCYVSMIVQKLSHMSCCQSNDNKRSNKIIPSKK